MLDSIHCLRLPSSIRSQVGSILAGVRPNQDLLFFDCDGRSSAR